MTGHRSSVALLAILAAQATGSLPCAASPAEPSTRPLQVADEQSAPRTEADAIQRRRAEELAKEASDRFSEILEKEKAKRAPQGAQPGAGPSRTAAADDALAPVWDWLARASTRYEEVIVAKLRNPGGEITILPPPGRVAAGASDVGTVSPSQAAPEPEMRLGWGSVVETRARLARARQPLVSHCHRQEARQSVGAARVRRQDAGARRRASACSSRRRRDGATGARRASGGAACSRG